MSSVIADIEQCYVSASKPAVKVYALRDCLVLDYTGYHTDATIGRRRYHQSLPFFENQVFITRVETYALLDGFATPTQLAKYLKDTSDLVQFDLTQLNAAPIIVHHPVGIPLATHF